jgi:hypothetical protein
LEDGVDALLVGFGFGEALEDVGIVHLARFGGGDELGVGGLGGFELAGGGLGLGGALEGKDVGIVRRFFAEELGDGVGEEEGEDDEEGDEENPGGAGGKVASGGGG